MEDLKVGDIIKERYELVKFLGSGSFGEVWLAHDKITGREVALKIYISLDPAGVEEFQREYSNTIDLSSQYLLTPEYFDVFHRRPFLVMKYCERGSSSKLAGNISEEQLWAFIEDVAKGLDVLHSQSDPIVHQDIKPDNILIDNNGRFLITDFGISKRLRATMRRQSRRDVSSGAMPYMAPERFENNPKLTTASDIWSLGASIYELATGELPFSGFGGAMQRNGAEMPILGSRYSTNLNEIMQLCLNPAAPLRPTAKELSNWANCKKVSSTYKTNHNATAIAQERKQTVREPEISISKNQSKPSLKWLLIVVVALVIGGIVWINHKDNSVDHNESSSVMTTDSVIATDSIVSTETLTICEKIQKEPSKIINREKIYFYEGEFYYGSKNYPVMVAFVESDTKIVRAVYKNLTYGSIIPLALSTMHNTIVLSGKDGANNFTITLEPAEGNSLVGTANNSNKSMIIRLIPTPKTFEMTNTISAKSEYPFDVSNVIGSFISKYSSGGAPWNCLNNTSAKRLSNSLETDNTPGGIFMVPFSAPLTVNGKALVSNQLDETIDWDIYLRGPNAGATNIVFSAIVQYVELDEIAQKIAGNLNAKYIRKIESEYIRDCVYLYSIGKLQLAIYCSFGAHGGSIECVVGAPETVTEYTNNCL